MLVLLQAENEVAALSRKLSLLEDDYEKSQANLKTANDRVHELTISADESERSVTSSRHAVMRYLKLFMVSFSADCCMANS